MKTKSINKKALVILLVAIVILQAIALTITLAWFTDQKTDSKTLEFGTIKVDLTNSDGTATNGAVSYNATRSNYSTGSKVDSNVDLATGKIMPGDKIKVSMYVKNVGTEDFYYLISFTSTGEVSANVTKTYTTSIVDASAENLGTLAPNSSQLIEFEVDIPSSIETQNANITVKCNIIAIQSANITKAEAFAELSAKAV